MKLKKPLQEYQKKLLSVKLPRWEMLPDFGIYNDQVISIVEEQLRLLRSPNDDHLLTPAMINNYVKLKLIDKPVKKKYYRVHIAQLLVITLLKQVLPLTEVKKGMELQIGLKGYQAAYDTFCSATEEALELIFGQLVSQEPLNLTATESTSENLALKMIALSLASKLLTQQIILSGGVTGQTEKREGLNHD